jgi:hypothetical protein
MPDKQVKQVRRGGLIGAKCEEIERKTASAILSGWLTGFASDKQIRTDNMTKCNTGKTREDRGEKRWV